MPLQNAAPFYSLTLSFYLIGCKHLINVSAGTGSQILVYDLTIGKLIRSFDVFDGIRVHGVSLEAFNEHLSDSHVTFKIAVYGERRVKLFCLQVIRISNPQIEQQACFNLTLSLVLRLPKFTHWVLDVSFLKVNFFLNYEIGASEKLFCDLYLL